MKPLRNLIHIDYKPNTHTELESGIFLPTEDSSDFFTVRAISVGPDCKEVQPGDNLYIRKEELYQTTDDISTTDFFTKEPAVLKINGHPAGNKVVLGELKEKKTKSGLYIPVEDENMYVVISVGTDCTDVSVSDQVMLDKYSGIKDGHHVITTESEISCILS